MTVHHGRDQWQRVRIAADSDGRLRGLSVDLLADMGDYLMLLTPGVPLLGGFMSPAIYKMDAYSFRCTGVFTTKMPTDAYRGAGRPEATFLIERIMDELAAELGMDPLEVRERNWIKHDELPYSRLAGLTYDWGNYEAATARAKELFGYDALRAEQAERNARGDSVRLGIGISTYTEMCGLAPSRVLGSLSFGAGGWEHASIRMLPTGKVEVVTGASAHGQGHETAWSQIVADQLGVPFEDIRVLHGDTQVAPKGMDTYGPRSLTDGGMAKGLGQALYGGAVYEGGGNLLTTTLADYLVPSAADLPSYITDRTETPAATRLGVKGVGEAGTIASTPAVVNAVVDALRPLGVRDVTMPCSPELVWRAIESARASAGQQSATSSNGGAA